MGGINFDIVSNAYIKNNYMSGKINVYNSNILNNIDFYTYQLGYGWGSYYDGHNITNSFITNNVSLHGLFGTTNENFQANSELIFPNGIIADNLQLPANSAAKGKGLGGVDCGPFGGDDPYCLSGLNYIPTIAKLSIPVKTTGSNGLAVKVIVRSNR
jgi:hypothetical protein